MPSLGAFFLGTYYSEPLLDDNKILLTLKELSSVSKEITGLTDILSSVITAFIVCLLSGINTFHETPSRDWFQTDAVLRVSLGNFLFFTILSVMMVGVKSQRDPRDSIHHGGWMVKVICWFLLVVLMFFIPNEIITFYGKKFVSMFYKDYSVCVGLIGVIFLCLL